MISSDHGIGKNPFRFEGKMKIGDHTFDYVTRKVTFIENILYIAPISKLMKIRFSYNNKRAFSAYVDAGVIHFIVNPGVVDSISIEERYSSIKKRYKRWVAKAIKNPKLKGRVTSEKFGI